MGRTKRLTKALLDYKEGLKGNEFLFCLFGKCGDEDMVVTGRQKIIENALVRYIKKCPLRRTRVMRALKVSEIPQNEPIDDAGVES